MKTTAIFSGAAIVLSTFTSAAPTPNTNIAERSTTVESERRAPEAEAEAAAEASPSTSDNSVLVRTEVDEDFLKREAATAEELGASAINDDACVIM